MASFADNWLSNRVFTSYQDILDHCCYVWNSLIEQPWVIMSIGMRKSPIISAFVVVVCFLLVPPAIAVSHGDESAGQSRPNAPSV